MRLSGSCFGGASADGASADDGATVGALAGPARQHPLESAWGVKAETEMRREMQQEAAASLTADADDDARIACEHRAVLLLDSNGPPQAQNI